MSIVPRKAFNPKPFEPSNDHRPAPVTGPADASQTRAAPEVGPSQTGEASGAETGARSSGRLLSSTEPVRRSVSSLGTPRKGLTSYQRLVMELRAEAELNASRTSSDDVTSDVVTRILESSSLEDAFSEQDPHVPNARIFADVPLIVSGITVLPSEYRYSGNSRLGVYAVVAGSRLDNGERVRFSTGAPNVVTRLWRAYRDTKLPLQYVIKAKPTANGEILSLRDYRIGDGL